MLRLPDASTRERFLRRQLADLGSDVYVAEADGGEIVGVVSIAYVRSFQQGRWAAVLDAAHATSTPLLDGLIAFGEERARRRGCRQLSALVDADAPQLRAALVSRGYLAGERLVAELGTDA